MESMTGFCSKKFSHPSFDLRIQARSLNNKYLDVIVKSGFFLRPLEEEVRKLVKEKFRRGRIEIHMDILFTSAEKQRVFINSPLLAELIQQLRPFTNSGILSLDGLLRLPGMVEYIIDEESFSPQEREFILEGVKNVLDCLKKAREREGKKIGDFLKQRLRLISRKRGEMERLFSSLKEKMKKELREKIQELLPEVDQGKLIQEVSALISRYDITEELARIKFHLQEFRRSLDDGGKKLDFIAQEILREANTINSKTQDPKIIKRSIIIKTTVEELREQIHNLE